MIDTFKQTQLFRFDQMAIQVTDKVEPEEAEVDRYVGLEHIDPESLKIRRWGEPSDVESSKILFKSGDIIFGKRRAYQRKLVVADFDGICSAHAMVLRPKTNVVLEEFLPFFMQSDIFMDLAVKISVGGLSPTINWRDLAKEEFALPPLEEQRRIAEVLLEIERLMDCLVTLKTSISTVRKSLLQFLLTNRDSWELVRLCEVAQIVGGGTPSTSKSEYWDGNITWLTPTEVVSANGETVRDSKRKITKEGLKNSSAKLLPVGTVLLTTRASVGAVAIAEQEVTTNQGFQSLIPSEKTTSEFLLLWCQNNHRQLLARASGSTFLEISSSEVKKLEIALPPLSIQAKIVAQIDHLDSMIKNATKRSRKLKKIKEGILEA
jgi:restriction endonuclease S subunit